MFQDLDDNYISSYAISMNVETQYQFTFKVPCLVGLSLKADPVAGLTLEGKLNANPTFVSLTAGIDLTPYGETIQEFDIRITASENTQMSQVRIYTE